MRPQPAPSATRPLSIGAIFVFGSLFAALCGCSQEPADAPGSSPPGPRVAEVRVLTLAPETWQQRIHAYGVVEPAEDIAVSVDFSAEVAAVHFDEGERVAAGQLLIELEAGKRALRLEQADAALAEARAGLDEARADHARRRGLAGSGAVSREILERSEAALARASARLEDAMAARALAEREVTESRVPSPADGIVERRLVEPGERVMPGQVLARIQTLGRVRVRAHVGEREVNDLAAGGAAEVRSPGVRGRVFEGVIESVGMRADPETGNFPVRLTLPNEDGRLRPGMTARVVLDGLAQADAILIPDVALVDRNRRRVVFLERDGKAVEIEPLLRPGVGERLQVLEGLAAGERLIVAGQEQLVDGSPVAIVAETQR